MPRLYLLPEDRLNLTDIVEQSRISVDSVVLICLPDIHNMNLSEEYLNCNCTTFDQDVEKNLAEISSQVNLLYHRLLGIGLELHNLVARKYIFEVEFMRNLG
ncbi:MAG: hypothetical protein MHMPM18_004192, partial [Marteilia pararefringens]